MTSDNIVPLPVKYRGSPRSSKTVEAELARTERTRAFRALSKTIEETKSIDLASRARLAKRLGALYDELKASGNIRGTIGKIFESAGLVGNSDTSPSKQLSRYVVPAGRPLIEKSLGSNPRNYERLTIAFAKALGRDPEEIALQAFHGILDGGAASGSASIEAEGLYDHLAIRLNSICSGIAYKHDLDTSFRAAIGWGLGMGQDGDWAPTLGYARFHPDNFIFDHWRFDEDNDAIDGMLPRAALVDWTIEVPVRATSKGVSGDEPAPDTVAFWMRNGTDFGMESTQIRITQFVKIALAPGPGGRPIPALIERYQTLIGDVPLTQWRSIGEGYYVFAWELENVREHNALVLDLERIDTSSLPSIETAMRKAVDSDGASRLRRVASSSMAEMLSRAEASAIEGSLDLPDIQRSAGLDDILPDDFLPSHSPSRTVAARIERNLVFLPREERPDVVLERAVISFNDQLLRYQRKIREDYKQAADGALERWSESVDENDRSVDNE